jgi:hypothetical protein
MIPRRNRTDLYTPAEAAIFDSIDTVESLGADTRLTDAVTLLGSAMDLVADYIDEQIAGCAAPPQLPDYLKAAPLASAVARGLTHDEHKAEWEAKHGPIDGENADGQAAPATDER